MVRTLPKSKPLSTAASARDQIVSLDSLAYARPSYLAHSAWTEHVPFAFWLVEALRPSLFVELGTHWGVSYFAFCQAIDKLEPGAKAFAVDSWTGDAHAGEYGPEVFQAVREYNENTYRHFSTLRKCSFDDAREYFLDSSIDLLHIDGLHTYEAVQHDFESWLPKMSPRGVVVFHDTNVREANFGVFRLFGELKESYSTFEFAHGHGLGIVGVGAEQTENMQRLFDAGRSDQERRSLHALFSGLGRACLSAYNSQKVDQTLADVKREFQAETAKYQEVIRQAEQRTATLLAEAQAATTARSQLDERLKQAEAEVAKHHQAVRQAEERADMLAADMEKQTAEIQVMLTTSEQSAAHAKQLEAKVLEYQLAVRQAEEKAVALAAELEERTSDVREASAAQNAANAHAARLHELREQQDALLRAGEEAAEQMRRDLQNSERRTQELQVEVDRTNEALEAMEKLRSDTEWRRGELEAIAAERERRILLLEDKLAVLSQSVVRSERELDTLQALHRDKEEEIGAAAKRDEELRHKLAETQSALAQRQHETEQYVEELASTRRDLDLLNRSFADQEKLVAAFKEHILLLMSDVKERQVAVATMEERYDKRLHEAEDGWVTLRKAYSSEREAHAEELRKAASENEAQLDGLRKAHTEELKKIKGESEGILKQRSDEIVMLTRLLAEAEAMATNPSERKAHAEELRKAASENEARLDELRKAHVEELKKIKGESESILKQRSDEIAMLSQLLAETEATLANRFAAVERAKEEAREALQRLGHSPDKSGSEISGFASLAGLELGRSILQMIELSRFWSLLPAKQRLKRKMELLRRSGVFEAEWYLGRYEDVANSAMDPMQHYIEYGAKEGREPNGRLATMK